MNVLLIRNNVYSYDETNVTGIYPPLGLAYIASVVRNAGYRTKILDNQVLRLKNGSFRNEIKKYAPDVALLSSMTPSWPELITLSRLIKDVSSRITVGVGGPHLTAYPTESLSHRCIDFGVYGEGETTILEALEMLRQGKDLHGVKGVISRHDGKVVTNAPREEIDDLDSIPFPAVDLLPYKKYIALSVRSPFFTIVTSRGCPYSCDFCFQGYLGRYRARSPENVVEEMENLVKKYDIQEIIVFDETFAAEEERALKICELIRKKRLKFNWDIRTRVDLLSKEILVSLKTAGCSRIHLGIESGNQEILQKMGKGLDIPEIIEKVRLAKKIGFELRGYFMLGYPGETRISIRETIEFAKSLPLDWASFTITIGLPETAIYKTALKKRYFDTDYWKEYTKGGIINTKPYFIPEGLDKKSLFALKKRAYLEFYMRPKIIWNVSRGLNFSELIKHFPLYIKLLPSIRNSIMEI
ncbi:MAG: hypothetical protein A2Z72_04705 [Omnitrophica bacterium RBG_13_46_9]|nr:MAG: hypothetical protein A2Z72_04705 [Omnitrophica bacterium RBG_13_46_9]